MPTPIPQIPVKRIDGTETTLAEFKNKVLLIVNVASKCGLTPQYEALEAVFQKYKNQGLVVLGFPANDFAGQEPGTNEEIQQFCQLNFNVSFPMFSKISVTGESKHPLYQQLTHDIPAATGNGDNSLKEKLDAKGLSPKNADDIMWNFEKFLISRTGEVVGRFAPNVAPDHAIITSAIEAELKKEPVSV